MVIVEGIAFFFNYLEKDCPLFPENDSSFVNRQEGCGKENAVHWDAIADRRHGLDPSLL